MIKPTYHNPATAQLQRWWAGTTIAGVLEQAARLHPDSTAVVDGDTILTFGELWQRSWALAGRLATMGVQPGDVIAVQLPNWWETFVVYGAAALRGAVCNPLVPLLRRRELAFMFYQSRPTIAVIPSRFRSTDYVAVHREVRDAVAAPPRVLVVRSGERDVGPFEPFELAGSDSPDGVVSPASGVSSRDVALLMYTSGTTAEPKGVLHHHDALVYEVRSIVELLGLGPDDPVFMVSPLSHISGYLFAFVLGAMTGAPAVLQDIWDPRAAVGLIERHGCRFTMAAPVFLQGLLEVYRERGGPSALAFFMCGGADVPSDLVRQARATLGTEVMRTYGLTEMPTLTSGRPGGGDANATTDGYVVGPARCRLDPDPADRGSPGELLVQGPELFCGYLDPAHNEAFTGDGFFRTGDLARTGPEPGTVTILGRAKDVIVRGGEKISAREVEEALLVHPAVADVAVVAMSEARLGERVAAFVVASEAGTPTVAALTEHLTALGMARQKHPERVVVVADLPRTASGKVQKHVLRAAIDDAPAQPVEWLGAR